MFNFNFGSQDKKRFLERLLLEMEIVWILKESDVIEKQHALERPGGNWLDNLCGLLVMAHYYSLNDDLATSEVYLERAQTLINDTPKRQKFRDKHGLACLQISLTFSEIIAISRKIRSDKVEQFIDLCKKFKKALDAEEKLQKSPAGIISASLVKLALCDVHFRLGPTSDHSLDEIPMLSEQLRSLITSMADASPLRVYALRALGDIEYHKGLMYFLKGDNAGAFKQFNSASDWFQKVQTVTPDLYCRILFCKNMLVATRDCGSENAVNIKETLSEIQTHLKNLEIPQTVKQKLELMECSFNLYKDSNYELGEHFVKSFGFHCDAGQCDKDRDKATEIRVLYSLEFLELIERKIRMLVTNNKWKDVRSCEIPQNPPTIICTFSHIFSIVKNLRTINSKTRSSVRRYTRLKELLTKEVQLQVTSLTFWKKKVFTKLLNFFARSGNFREYKILLDEYSKLSTSDQDIEKSGEILERSPVVSTRNGIFLYFDNFKDGRDENSDHDKKKLDNLKMFNSKKQGKDTRSLCDLLGVSDQSYFHHDQKRRSEILEEISAKSSVVNYPALEVLVIFFIGHGIAHKRETEFETVLKTAQDEDITLREIKEAVSANLKCFTGRPPVAWIIVDTCRGATDLGNRRVPDISNAESDMPSGEPCRRYDELEYCDGDFVVPDDLDDPMYSGEPSTSAPTNVGGNDVMPLPTGNHNENSDDDDDDNFYCEINSLEGGFFADDEPLESSYSSGMFIDNTDVIDPVQSSPAPNIVVTYATLNLCYAYTFQKSLKNDSPPEKKDFPLEKKGPVNGYSPFMKALLQTVKDEEFYGGRGPWNLRQLLRILNSNMTKVKYENKKTAEVLLQRSTGEDSLRMDIILSKDR